MTKPTTTLVTKAKLSDVVKTEATVDMNSIVAFFISKYENTLFDTKKQLSDKINELNSYLNKEFVALIEKEVKIDSYKVTVKALGLTTTAELQINTPELERRKRVFIRVTQAEKSQDCNFNLQKSVVISDDLHKAYMDKVTEINTLRTSLHETLDKLSNINRKERELRGALAEKTLRDAGVGELFEDETLLNLVQTPSLSMKVVS